MIRGLQPLLTRMDAIKPDLGLMRDLALASVREQKILVPRRTGNLGRSIHVGAVTPTRAETVASASYAAFVELGTKPHLILPRTAKVLAFAPRGTGRLSGAPRKGGAVIFARRVRHPGMRAQPFMLPGAKNAVTGLGLKSIVVRRWNEAA